jgi:hypothetical protein
MEPNAGEVRISQVIVVDSQDGVGRRRAIPAGPRKGRSTRTLGTLTAVPWRCVSPALRARDSAAQASVFEHRAGRLEHRRCRRIGICRVSPARFGGEAGRSSRSRAVTFV